MSLKLLGLDSWKAQESWVVASAAAALIVSTELVEYVRVSSKASEGA